MDKARRKGCAIVQHEPDAFSLHTRCTRTEPQNDPICRETLLKAILEHISSKDSLGYQALTFTGPQLEPLNCTIRDAFDRDDLAQQLKYLDKDLESITLAADRGSEDGSLISGQWDAGM